jgi:lysophospholipid acyltransferase (LPLAT)-like uncharacterized protein
VRLKISPVAARRVGGPLMRFLATSWRIDLGHEERWRRLYETGQPHVFLLWHEALLPLLWQHRDQDIAIVVSEAREGRYLAEFAEKLGYRALYGSSTRGGARALLAAVRELQAGRAVAFTPDGPRGPRRRLKPGIITAAQRGGAPIVPLHAESDRAWRLHSWDRFMIPKPFAQVRITYGHPFQVGPGEDGFAEGMERAEAGLHELSGNGAWRDAVIATG